MAPPFILLLCLPLHALALGAESDIAAAQAHLARRELISARDAYEKILNGAVLPERMCEASLGLAHTLRGLGALREARDAVQRVFMLSTSNTSEDCRARAHAALGDLGCILGSKSWPLHLRRAHRLSSSVTLQSGPFLRLARLHIIEGSCYLHHKYHHSSGLHTSPIMQTINETVSFEAALQNAQQAVVAATSIYDTLEALSISATAIDRLGHPDTALRIWKMALAGSEGTGYDVSDMYEGIAQAGLALCTMASLPTSSLCNVTEVIRFDRMALRARGLIGPRPLGEPNGVKLKWQDVLRRQIPGRVQKTRFAIQQPLALLQKVRHDLEQLDCILSPSIAPPFASISGSFLVSFRHALGTLARSLPKMSPGMTTWSSFEREMEIAVPQEQREVLARGFGRILHMPPPPRHNQNRMLRESLNGRAIEEIYYARGGVAVVDDVLSPSALQEVQRHAAEAIIWHDPRESYVGAYGNSGLLTSTTVRIAAELGKLLPRVICGRRLRQLWAYKFSKDNQARPLADSGINVHADDALVSVNIWVQGGDEDSEGESLTSGGGGGLLVYPGYRSGIGESFQQYNRQPGRIRRLLSAAGAKFDRIEHKVNRAVIFDSSIFHESDAGTARTYGSELKTRRINLTFLFGRRGEGCHEEKSKRVDDAS